MSAYQLVEWLQKSGVLHSDNLVEAFKNIDRSDFVPVNRQSEAYEDHALPIGYGQTISQPSTVASMLELLQPKAGQRILDVGSGSGWTTALLAQVAGPSGRVIGLERVAELVQFGAANLKKYHLPWAEIRQAGTSLGVPHEAPFNRILVSAAASRMPDELLAQLAVGGILVVPIDYDIWRFMKTSQDKFETDSISGFIFVPLID